MSGATPNLDGIIDTSDVIIWNQNVFTAGNGWCGGDFNADGVTDLADLVIICINAPPNFCDDVVATEQSSWGAAKAYYR